MTRRKLPVSAFLWRSPCPDCCATFDADRRLRHEETCPLGRAIEDACNGDKAWFLDNPAETVRVRAATHAEVQDLKHLAPTVARPSHVHVHRHLWGRSRLFVSGGDDQMLILDTDG